MIIEVSNSLTAFEETTIGTKVINPYKFLFELREPIKVHDTSKDRVPGQHFINLPQEMIRFVSCGVGQRTTDPADYLLRTHRGRVEHFLKREKTAKVISCACVVYTKQAYLADPDVINTTEYLRISSYCCDYILVAVLASAGSQSPLTPDRLVHNLAGGNNEVESWSKDDIIRKAQESKSYWDDWCTVAD